MKNRISTTLEELLAYFPLIEPPLTLSGKTIPSFSAQNRPIPARLIEELFSKWESFDEYTEIIPCFQLDSKNDHFIIVYWKGSLLSYQFILMTLNKSAGVLSKKVIAGTLSNNQTVMESVAVIDEELNIFSVSGASDDLSARKYNPEHSQSFRFEIDSDGSIHSFKEE